LAVTRRTLSCDCATLSPGMWSVYPLGPMRLYGGWFARYGC